MEAPGAHRLQGLLAPVARQLLVLRALAPQAPVVLRHQARLALQPLALAALHPQEPPVLYPDPRPVRTLRAPEHKSSPRSTPASNSNGGETADTQMLLLQTSRPQLAPPTSFQLSASFRCPPR